MMVAVQVQMLAAAKRRRPGVTDRGVHQMTHVLAVFLMSRIETIMGALPVPRIRAFEALQRFMGFNTAQSGAAVRALLQDPESPCCR